MAPRSSETYLVRTKLHRPPLPSDQVAREALVSRLEPDGRRPFTLVCAPAGYGKTTLVVQWLEKTDVPVAWLSLDENDNDLRTFLDYLLATVRYTFPDSCSEVTELLSGKTLPPSEVIAARLSNDLDAIDEHFVLVLDDTHRIHEPEIHETLDRLLEFPPRGLHLVMIARRDPPLSLQLLRARGAMTEIRQRDLQFTEEQTAAFFGKKYEKALNHKTLERLHKGTEGWPVALRLVAIALHNRTDANELLRGFTGDSHQIEEYLLAEVLSLQPEQIRTCVLRVSILDRFCAPLCDEVCHDINSPEGESPGSTLIQALREASMPCVPLDDRNEWYRFHHLFEEMLRRSLRKEYNEDDIKSFHQRAADWFGQQGFVEDALRHYLQSGAPSQTACVIAQYRQRAVNNEQWPRLAQWLDMIPKKIVFNDAGLLMLLARVRDKQGRYVECVETMDRAEKLLNDISHGSEDHDLWLGWLYQLRGIFAYHFLDGKGAIDLSERALLLLPADCASERVYAYMTLGASYQMCGDAKQGYQVVYDALEREGSMSPTHRARLMQALCYMHWIGGNLPALRQTATTLLELGHDERLAETVAHGRYFLGAALYHLNELVGAEEVLEPLASDPFAPIFIMHMNAVYTMSQVHLACGRPDAARELSDSLVSHMLATGNTQNLSHALAHQSDLAMIRGKHAEALQWSSDFQTGQTTAGYNFISPDFSVVRTFIRSGSTELLDRAEKILESLYEFFSSHNVRFTIEALLCRAMLEDRRGNQDIAVAKLIEAVEMARPGGNIRTFFDMGPEILPLLQRVEVSPETSIFLSRIRAAFPKNGKATAIRKVTFRPHGDRGGEDALTNREVDILDLLSQRLTNKEIGLELNISPETVKRHTKNIYQKLYVGSRREAVTKAAELGLLRPD